MKKVICELYVQNKTNATTVVASSILKPKQRTRVKFFTIKQIESALLFERFGRIRIDSEIPEGVAKLLNLTSKKDELESAAKISVEEVKVENATVVENAVEQESATEEKNIPTLTEKEIEEMSKSEVLKFMKENGIDTQGLNNRSRAEDVKNAILTHYGYELISE